MGLVGIHDLDALCCFNGMTHCPWCGKEGQNEGTVINHLWMVHYRLGLVCNKCYNYLSTSSDTLHCHMVSRTANPQEREALMSQPHPDNCQQETCTELISPNWESEQRSQGELSFPRAALLGTPPPISTTLEENQTEKAPPANPQCPITCFPAHLDQAAAH